VGGCRVLLGATYDEQGKRIKTFPMTPRGDYVAG